MSDREKKAIIEALLFVWGQPLFLDDIAQILEIGKAEARRLVGELEKELVHNESGLVIRSYDDSFQLGTRKDHDKYISKLFKNKKTNRLSNSSMETLALIAYKQPITRLEVDQIRGVNSTSPIETLLNRGLIEEAGRLDQIGRPILYKTSLKFLQDFDLQSLKELPDMEKLEMELGAITEKEEDSED